MVPDKVDWAYALETVEGDRAELAEMIKLFFAESAQRERQIEDAIAQQDGPQLRLAAHTLKSALGYFGPSLRLRVLAEELEAFGKEGRFEEAPERQRELLEMLPPFKAELQAFVDENASPNPD